MERLPSDSDDNARIRSLQSDLRRKVGVHPSRQWLMDCVSALRSTTTPNSDLSSDCWQQILHHDLRDVVRTSSPTTEPQQQQQQQQQQAPRVIRRALQDARTPQHHYKAELPATFCLLVQVEECVNVSQNDTTRLEVGANAAPTTTGGGRSSTQRCLKLAWTDGYDPVTGTSYCNQADNTENQALNTTTTTRRNEPQLVAMEVTAIPQLSSTSRAGTKVMLKGPISVRHGILLLHPGNAVVLGGHVPALAKRQRDKLQAAQLKAGVGVDATIRALIGTAPPPAEEDEQNQDEGEHESRDVEPAPALVANMTTHVAPPVPPRAAAVTVPPSQPTTSPSFRSPVPFHETTDNHRMQQAPVQRAIPMDAEMIHIDDNENNSNKNSNNPAHARGASNPYAAAAPAAVVRNANPYSTSSSSSSNHRRAISPTPPQQHPVHTRPAARQNPYAAPTSTTVHASSIPSTTTNSTATTAAATTATESTTATLKLTFVELRNILERIQRNPELHHQYLGRTFSCWLKQVGSREAFNIQKCKKAGAPSQDEEEEDNHDTGSKKKKKKDRQYEYWLVAKFAGEHSGDNLITCQVASEIQQPFFVLPPKEMRELHRSKNREEAKRRVHTGGGQLMELFKPLRCCELQLLDKMPAELGGSQPVLLIKRVLGLSLS